MRRSRVPAPEQARSQEGLLSPGGQPGLWASEYGAAAHVLVDGLDDEVVVTGGDGHHLARVRRLRSGESVTAADGRGRWRPYAVADNRAGALRLESAGPEVREPLLEPRLTVAFALTKGSRPDLVVAKVTELGADAIIPLRAARSVASRASTGAGRLARVAREAAAQCRRSWLPHVGELVPVEALTGRPGLVLADRDGIEPGEIPDPAGGGWTLVVGPEGGLGPEERVALRGAVSVRLGRHVLRAETAAIAGAATLGTRRRTRPVPG